MKHGLAASSAVGDEAKYTVLGNILHSYISKGTGVDKPLNSSGRDDEQGGSGKESNTYTDDVEQHYAKPAIGMLYQPLGLAEAYGVDNRSPVDLVTAAENWGYRYGTNQPKGEGWLGNVGTKDTAVTEYTINAGGRELPTLVPTLNKEEINAVRHAALSGTRVPDSVTKKAIDWANMRNSQGLSQFKD